MAGVNLPGLLLGFLLIQAVDGPDPEELASRLGSNTYADREAVGEALVKIGREALPALGKAAESRDPEVRRRAATLAARIEAGEVLNATRVRLDVQDRPLAEAVEAIERESAMRLRPGVGVGKVGVEPTWPEGRVTLEAAEPVPFWEAVDRLCAAGGLQRLYPPAGDNFFPFRPPFEWTLVPGKARPPASDTGALRVELLRVRHDRERDYGQSESEFSPFPRSPAQKPDPETGATVRSSYRAEILVSAEPRLRIFGVGSVEGAEAVDDRGRSLLRIPTGEERQQELTLWQMNPHLDPRINPALRYGAGSRSSAKSWPVPVLLSYPSPPAQRLARLRGVIPLVVVARRPNPLVVDLKGASSKVFSAGSTRITVHEITAGSGREPTVDFTLEAPAVGDGETIMVCDSKGARLAVNRPIDLLQLCLEVLDSRGESLFWQYTRAPSQRTQGRMTIVVRDRNGKRERPEDLRIRYWGIIGAATDLPFAFNDVPTP
jgi:hypothetical protein